MKLIWHKDPDQAIARTCRQLEEVRKKEGESFYLGLLKKTLKTDPWFTMRVALQWGWLDEDLVGYKFIRHVSENWGSDLKFLLPRGHGKTLPMSAIVITAILNKPDTAILEISRTEDNAKKFGILVADTLMGNDMLQQCFASKYNKDGFLPSSQSECKQWGESGYKLPGTKPRLDPTLLCIASKAAKAGKHPDWIYLDDLIEEENNTQLGWDQAEKVVDGCKLLLPASGFFCWTATRWDDRDPMGKAELGKLRGKQGQFKVLKCSCYVDDNPKKGPTYPRKRRWNMKDESGYTVEMLNDMSLPKKEGGLGLFFAAQMRNNPLPEELADLNVDHIGIYTEENQPKLSQVRLMGIETTGGGAPIFNGLNEWLEDINIYAPTCEISNPKKKGSEKKDRIVAALQPLIEAGKLKARAWMIGDKHDTEGLGYEIRRLGKALHDDIIDALHNVPTHLSKSIHPNNPSDPADLYISVDLAWTEEKKSDWTVAIAVAVDHTGCHWIIDYDRFQISSPTAIYHRLLAFYQKFEEQSVIRKSNKKFPGAWR